MSDDEQHKAKRAAWQNIQRKANAHIASTLVSDRQQKETTFVSHSFSANVPKLAQQIAHIVATAQRLGYDPLAIPADLAELRRAKAEIRAACLADRKLFSHSSFRHAWKAAVKSGAISKL